MDNKNTGKKSNPITIRSKKWIADSLLELMRIKPYHDITIKEIAANADLVRQTVYRNFKSKDAILEYYVSDFLDKFTQVVSTKEKITLYDLVVTYFEYWFNNKELLELLIKNDVYIKLLDIHLKYMENIGSDPKIARLIKMPKDANGNYLNHFSAGGLWFTVKKWIEDDTIIPPNEMAKTVLDFYNIRRVNVRRLRNTSNLT